MEDSGVMIAPMVTMDMTENTQGTVAIPVETLDTVVTPGIQDTVVTPAAQESVATKAVIAEAAAMELVAMAATVVTPAMVDSTPTTVTAIRPTRAQTT